MPHCLIAPMAWKLPGRWSIRSWKPGAAKKGLCRSTQRGAGDRKNPTNYWSAMGDSGANRSGLPREVLPNVYVCADPTEVARAAARRFVDWAWQAIARDGHFNAALAGGSTPKAMYR